MAPCAQGGAGLQRFLVGAADTVAALSTGGAADVALAVCAAIAAAPPVAGAAVFATVLGGLLLWGKPSAVEVRTDDADCIASGFSFL